VSSSRRAKVPHAGGGQETLPNKGGLRWAKVPDRAHAGGGQETLPNRVKLFDGCQVCYNTCRPARRSGL